MLQTQTGPFMTRCVAITSCPQGQGRKLTTGYSSPISYLLFYLSSQHWNCSASLSHLSNKYLYNVIAPTVSGHVASVYLGLMAHQCHIACSYIVILFCLWVSFYLCAHIHIWGSTFAHVHIWQPQVEVMFPESVSTWFFETGSLLIWTWSLKIWLDWGAKCPRDHFDSTYLVLGVLGFWYCMQWSDFMWCWELSLVLMLEE